MKYLFFLLLLITRIASFGQFNHVVTLRATANVNIVFNGLAENDAGVGVGLDASFFSKNKLQVLLETSADEFVGDKQLFIDTTTGEEAKNAAVCSIKVGPQFFITKNMALAVTYGPSWHVAREFEYSLDYGFKYSLTGFFGQRRHFVTKVFVVDIPVVENRIQYLGIAAGIRF